MNIQYSLSQGMSSQKCRSSSSAVGSYLLHLAAGITPTWGVTNIYFLSYFHESDQSINTTNTNSYILIAVVIPLSIALALSTKICEKIGFSQTIRICSVVFFLSQFAIYFKFSPLIFVVFSLIIPVSCVALSLIPTMNLLWAHFPEKKSICTAINVVCLGLGTIIWNFAFTSMVNPTNQEAKSAEGGNEYFPKSVTSQVFNTAQNIFMICSTIYLIGAFLIKNHPNSTLSQQTEDNSPQKQNKSQNKVQIRTIQQPKELHQQNSSKQQKVASPRSNRDNQFSQVTHQTEEQLKLNKENTEKKNQLFHMLKEKKCFLIFILVIINDIYPIYLLNNFKIIYLPIFNDDHFLASMIVVNTVCNILGTFLWGFLAQKFGNITTIALVAGFGFLSGLFGIFSSHYFALVIFIILVGLADRGMETIIGPALVEIYGLKSATMLLPVKGFCLIVGFLIAPVFQILTSSIFNPFQQLQFLNIFSILSFLIGAYYSKTYNHFDKVKAQKIQKRQQKVDIQLQQVSNIDSVKANNDP